MEVWAGEELPVIFMYRLQQEASTEIAQWLDNNFSYEQGRSSYGMNFYYDQGGIWLRHESQVTAFLLRWGQTSV
jgi:hypothetical protein